MQKILCSNCKMQLMHNNNNFYHSILLLQYSVNDCCSLVRAFYLVIPQKVVKVVTSLPLGVKQLHFLHYFFLALLETLQPMYFGPRSPQGDVLNENISEIKSIICKVQLNKHLNRLFAGRLYKLCDSNFIY